MKKLLLLFVSLKMQTASHKNSETGLIRYLLLISIILASGNFVAKGQNCSVNAGVDFSLCANSTLTLGGGKAGLFQGAGNVTWSQVSGPSAVITDPSNLGTTVTSIVGGNVYKFRLSATCLDGSLAFDEVTVTALAISQANAGSDQSVCPGNAVTNLAGSALSTGETGLWTIQGTNNGVTIVTPSSPTSAININSANSGNTTLRWTVTNGTCSSFDDVIITNRGGVSVVTAGADRSLNSCYATTQSTSQNASLGGGGIALGQTGLWSVVDGPNIPTIASPNAYNSTISNLIQGVYTFRWTVSGTCVNGTAIMHLTVPAPNGGITSASISPATASFCDGRTSVVLVGSVPTKPNETVLWTKTGTAGGTIDSPGSTTINITGLVPGPTYSNSNSYTYTISSTNGCPASTASRSVSWIAPPSLNVTTASPLLLGCGVTSATINYTSSGGSGSVQWMILSGPTTTTYPAIPTSWTNGGASSVTLTGLTKPGTYQLRFQKSAGSGSSCNPVFQDLTLVVAPTPTASNAGTDQVLACNVFNTNLVGNIPSVGTGMWTQVSGPNTATLPSPSLNNSPISGLISGKYTFRWLIFSGNACPNSQNDVSVIVSDPTPTASAAGSDLSICNSTPLILTGNSPKLNETGVWTVTPSSGISFSDSHSPDAIATGMASNTTYTFTWTISNACGTSSDNVNITTNATVGPIPSDAGPDQCIPAGTTTATMAGNSPGAGTGTWTQVSGSPAVITNPLQNNTTITGLSGGTSKFEWSIARNTCTVTRDTVTLTISAPATTANAGPDQTACGSTATLAGNTPLTGTGYWTQTGGPGGAVLADPASPNLSLSGLIAGAYTFRWKISNDACASSFDDVQLNVSSLPTPANAGPDQSICSGTSVTMAGNIIGIGTGVWTLITGPNSPTITAPTSPGTTITGLTNGTYDFRWRSFNGIYCPVSNDDVIVDVTQAVTNASLGGNQSLCGASSATLTGNQSTIGTWTQDAGGPNVSTITPISSSTSLATGLIPGVYTFRYTYTTPTTCSNTATITVTIAAMPNLADAGPDMNICDVNSVAMAGNLVSAGAGQWSRVSGPNNPNIVTPASPTTSIGTTTGLINGTYIYRWTITNGSCITSDDMMINRSSSATVANAGPDQLSVCGSLAVMAANTPAPGVGTWSQISGPNTATISSVILPTTTITGMIPGTYVFRWSITNGFCSPSTDDVSITTFATPTTANAGPDQTLCGNTSTTLAGNTITIGTGQWTQISGPNTAVFALSTDPATTVSGLIAGTYVFQWTSLNGSCSSSDNVSVSITTPPTVSVAGPDQNICLFAAITLTGNTPVTGTGLWTQISGNPATIQSPSAPTTSITGVTAGSYGFRWTITNGTCPPSTDDVIITVNDLPSLALAGPDLSLCNVTSVTMAATAATVGIGTWTYVSGPNIPVFTNPNLANTTVTGMIPGTYVFDWSIANGPCISSDQIQVIIAALPTTANAGADLNLCGTSTATLEGNAAMVGLGTWTRVSGPNTPVITNINSESSTVTGLITGTYVFKWTISNGSCVSSSDNVQVAVTTGTVTTSVAGPDQTGATLCGLTTATLAANVPVTGTGLWSLHSGTGGTFGNTSDNASTFTGNAGSTYIARWTITNGTCSSFDDVTITFPRNPTISNAGPDMNGTAMCGANSVILNGNTPTIGTGLWSIVSGSGGSFDNASNPAATFSGTAGTIYSLRWTISNSPCTASTDLTSVDFKVPPTAPSGTSNQSFCTPDAPTLNNIAITGNNVIWYDASSGGTTLPGTTLLVNGAVYYASQTINGCESLTRKAFNVTLFSCIGPVIEDATRSINENSPNGTVVYDINDANSGDDDDPDGNSLTYSIIGGNSSGAFTIDVSTGIITVADASKIDFELYPSFAIIIRVSNGTKTDNSTITINLINENDNNPVATADNYTVNEGETLIIPSPGLLSNDYDIDGNSITSQKVTDPLYGILTLNSDGSFTYAHDGSETINDSFTYRVFDGLNYSNIATVTITINAVNDPPVVSTVNKSGSEDQEISFSAADFTAFFTDPENNSLTKIMITSLPLNGTLKLSGVNIVSGNEIQFSDFGSLTFMPDPNWNGNTSFGWNGFDGTVYALTSANVNITVNAVNDLPQVSDITKTGSEDNTISFSQADFTGSFTDIDGNSLSQIMVTSLPANGTLRLSGMNVAVNDIILYANLGNLTFTPNTNWNGSTSFGWNGNDGSSYALSPASVNITISAVNDAPAVTDISKAVNEDSILAFASSDFTSAFSDSDGNSLSRIKIISLPTNGLLKLSGVIVSINDEITLANLGNLTFTPAANWNGTTTFSWNGNDGTIYANTPANVSIVVNPVNDIPVLASINRSVNEDNTLVFAASDFTAAFTDIDGNTLVKILITSLPANGTLKLSGAVVAVNDEIVNSDLANLTFTPDTHWTGSTSFSWNGFDGSSFALSDANVNITVNPVNNPPVISDISKSVNEDNTMNFAATDFINSFSDIDGNTLVKIKIISLPANGLLKLSGVGVNINDEIPVSQISNLTFAPGPDWNGTTHFGWNGNDGTVYSLNDANVNIIANSVNDAPVINPSLLLVTTNENRGALQISISGNVTDVDGNSFTTSILKNPGHGTVTITASGNLVYTPANNYAGNDTIDYQVCDNGTPQLCANGRVIITVNSTVPVNHAPSVTDISKTTVENKSFMFSTNDFKSAYSDADNDTLTKVEIITNPSSGSLSINNATVSAGQEILWIQLKSLEYIPQNNFKGDASFMWKASDGKEYSASANVVITVTPALLFIPEGFSPNGDGINDFFVIGGIEDKVASISIYNRWGNLVYSNKDYKNDWDGLSNAGLLLGSKLPDGTYFYVIDLHDGEKAKIGYITINR
jgi:gliding motility-associated-like protein